MEEIQARLESALADRYVLERKIGCGGHAVVYLAHDLKHHRSVAIKVLRPELAATLGSERFLREIEIEARLTHPHILPLHDSGRADGLLYFTMPYVEGESLRQRLDREKQLPLDEALRITREVADALAYAHTHGVIHRDIKPANILLEAGHAVVSDFGIARAVSAAGSDQLTQTGLAVGTPAYMSPEQASGDFPVDGRADVYSLASVLYEMLAGDPPYSGPTAQAVLAKKMGEQLPNLRLARETVPRPVEHALTTALAKIPADRFDTAEAFANALEGDGSVDGVRLRRVVRRVAQRKGGVVAGTALVAALLALGVLSGLPERLLSGRGLPLDPNRVVVFPLDVRSEDSEERLWGEDLATVIGVELDRAGSLRWIDGWNLMTPVPQGVADVSVDSLRTLARGRRAGYFVHGRVIPRRDSVDVNLALYYVNGDSTAGWTRARAARSDPWVAGLSAAARLVPLLISTQSTVQAAVLMNVRPAAVAHFLRGERLHRRSQFRGALSEYEQALSADSTLAVAALRGAVAATWEADFARAAELTQVALDDWEQIPPRHRTFARGLQSFLVGAADSATAQLKRVIAEDSLHLDARMALGEVYTHLLPSAQQPLTGLAESTFVEIRRLDPRYAPPLYHLVEAAVRKGDAARANGLLREYRSSAPDSQYVKVLELMVECVERGERDVDWERAAQTWPWETFEAAKSLSAGLSHFRCAEAGWRAILQHDTAAGDAGDGRRWGAAFGLQSLLVAQARYEEASRLLDSTRAAGIGNEWLWWILDALAGAPCVERAAVEAERFGANYAELPSEFLWLLGNWKAFVNDTAALMEITTVLRSRADTIKDRITPLVARSVGALAALTAGDSLAALSRFRGLAPTGNVEDLTWSPWDALAGERLAFAQLLLAKGEYAEAIRVATAFDSPTPAVYLMYVPASLRLRLLAAEGLRDSRAVKRLRTRLVSLGRFNAL